MSLKEDEVLRCIGEVRGLCTLQTGGVPETWQVEYTGRTCSTGSQKHENKAGGRSWLWWTRSQPEGYTREQSPRQVFACRMVRSSPRGQKWSLGKLRQVSPDSTWRSATKMSPGSALLL